MATLCYLGLYALQHRGQEGAGIVTFDGRMRLCKVSAVRMFLLDNLAELEGLQGLAMCASRKEERHVINTQPFLRSSYGSWRRRDASEWGELQEKLLVQYRAATIVTRS